jgi:H+/Cl- antiporter ClcA
VRTDERNNRQRITRLLVAGVVFAGGAIALMVLVARLYLLPAYAAWRNAPPAQRDVLSASSALLLALVLVILLLLLIAAFGVRRYFFPPPPTDRTVTPYVDAWAKAGRRARVPSESDD